MAPSTLHSENSPSARSLKAADPTRQVPDDSANSTGAPSVATPVAESNRVSHRRVRPRVKPLDDFTMQYDTSNHLRLLLRLNRHLDSAARLFAELKQCHPDLKHTTVDLRLVSLRDEILHEAAEPVSWLAEERGMWFHGRSENILDEREGLLPAEPSTAAEGQTEGAA